MSIPQMTTAEALRSALASTIACSAQELQEAVGQLVAATTSELPPSAVTGADARSVFDPQARITVLLADRIPAGQEAQALVDEIERHHGRQAAQLVLGERANELLGGDGKVSNYTHATRTVYQPNAALWPDALASFEAFATIQEGRRHYPEIPEDQWVAVPESDIEDPTIFEDEGGRKVQGSVEHAEAVNKLTDAVQVERNTMLLGRNQVAMAERAFEAYNWGEGVAVAGVSEWEYYAAGHERSREVYVEKANKDGKENPSTRLGFTVRYDPQTGVLAEAYAEDAVGTAFGFMPEGQLEKLNADSAVGKVEPPTATLREPLGDAALKIIKDVCRDFDGNGIYSVGAGAALRAMAHHWKDHLHEGHTPRIISDDIDEMRSQLEIMRAEVMRRVAEQTAPQFEGELPVAIERSVAMDQKYRVLGAHPNRNFFAIEVEASDGLSAFGVAALSLKGAEEDGEAEFFAAIPAHIAFDFPGDGVVTLGTVLDPEQADVFGLEASANVDDDHSPGM